MPGGKMRAVRWTPVHSRLAEAELLLAPRVSTPPVDPLVAAIRELGVPRGPEAVQQSPRDEAIFFLQVAAEVEHALLVQYLYAAYSLDPSRAEGVTWRDQIVEIATEEMGHLVTVQNLLRL